MASPIRRARPFLRSAAAVTARWRRPRSSRVTASGRCTTSRRVSKGTRMPPVIAIPSTAGGCAACRGNKLEGTFQLAASVSGEISPFSMMAGPLKMKESENAAAFSLSFIFSGPAIIENGDISPLTDAASWKVPSSLFPRQAAHPPAVDGIAMTGGILVPFETLLDVVQRPEAVTRELLGRRQRAVTAAADRKNGRALRIGDAMFLQGGAHAPGEMGIDLPVREFLPGHVQGARRMADIVELHAAAHVQQHRAGRAPHHGMGLLRVDATHGCRHAASPCKFTNGGSIAPPVRGL